MMTMTVKRCYFRRVFIHENFCFCSFLFLLLFSGLFLRRGLLWLQKANLSVTGSAGFRETDDGVCSTCRHRFLFDRSHCSLFRKLCRMRAHTKRKSAVKRTVPGANVRRQNSFFLENSKKPENSGIFISIQEDLIHDYHFKTECKPG